MSYKQTISKKNGVELFRIDWFGETMGYELWIDGEFFNRYQNEKEAKRFFKDFAAAY